ncbi:B12-binding domain-containing radical SAM protein [Streptomyces violaceusniger]|uniref:Radical SAM domain protein n=1 Tax=Streptomyces violaceusniger (strain Tu 4113) TaxID=653045 RepID=G2PI24_STRV4|nr:radical SAM protein [Streptomyces violaceusniger]AEM88975.1 Radical SAM domain protein [Streptomyces violaceusniger Tu 4113]
MSQIENEIRGILARETRLAPEYEPKDPTGLLRMVFLFPYGHAYSLMCNGPMSLHHLINSSPGIPAVAERALQFDCLTRDGNRLTTPDGEPYRSIESPAPVSQADIVGVSVINSGDLHSVLRLLDLAGIPRRTADRVPGVHPLVVGGNQGLADPEPLADYLDVVAIGDAEDSLAELIRTVHAHRHNPDAGTPSLHEQLARIPGLYVPSMYVCDFAPGGGVHQISPKTLTVPDTVTAQYLQLTEQHPAHFTYPITDGTAAGLHPVRGCLHTCHFCNLGVPPFRQAPLDVLTAYVDQLEQLKIRKIIISAPTFTQYRHRRELLDHILAYAKRAEAEGEKVTTIIGSVRADEITQDYLEAITELGDFGHLFTELHLTQARGIITIAPEWASHDLVALYGKTQKRERVNKALDLCRQTGHVNTVMLYFIVGAPGELEADRLAIADYAQEVRARLGDGDANVIIKLHQFMPKPGTPTQRLKMADPDLVQEYGARIADRLRSLVGQKIVSEHYRVEQFAASRMHLEAVCSRGDRRIGHVLEDLYDTGVDLAAVTKDQLVEAMAKRDLDYVRHLRHMDDPVLPWHILNHVNRAAEQQLSDALTAREERP